MKALRIHPNDNVAVAVTSCERGEVLTVSGISCRLNEAVLTGHKFALTAIPKDDPVIKYGVPIGHAKKNIRPGDWVHIHNMSTNLSAVSAYSCRPAASVSAAVKKPEDWFTGYLRKDGRAGIRNELWIIPTVGCVNSVVRRMAGENQDLVKNGIDGLYAFSHPYGCSQTGADLEQTKRFLAAMAKHPNAGGVLVVGLGCENLTMDSFREALGSYDPERIRFLVVQDSANEQNDARDALLELAAYASCFLRQPLPLDQLVIGCKCGGSDGLSGITANPLVGKISDRICCAGGSSILTEVPEMFGAEEFLLGRCASRSICEKTVGMINSFKNYYLSHNEVIYKNPSPGNKSGGISTLEEKSCGCVQKGGTFPVTDVIPYAAPLQTKGLNLLSAPGNDMVSASALAVSGAQIILFTTGRGTPFGCPVPVLKISSNSELAARKPGWIDFDAGCITGGAKTLEEATEFLFRLVIDTACGRQTKSEYSGYRDLAIFKNGVTL
jgi:altronate hydrolase